MRDKEKTCQGGMRSEKELNCFLGGRAHLEGVEGDEDVLHVSGASDDDHEGPLGRVADHKVSEKAVQ